jgi:ArsR family transcriptional regulator
MNAATGPSPELIELAARFKVLAEPNRLRIVQLLMAGVQCNCVLGDRLQMPPNLISHHLHILLESGLVQVERSPRDARWLYYSINPEAFAELTRLFQAFYDPERIQPRLATCGPVDQNGDAMDKPSARRCKKC